MIGFLKGFLLIIFIFCCSIGFALFIRFMQLYKKFKTEACEPPQKDPKVYYIKETILPKKRRKSKKKKSPDIPLKGIVLSPEEFKKIERKVNKSDEF